MCCCSAGIDGGASSDQMVQAQAFCRNELEVLGSVLLALCLNHLDNVEGPECELTLLIRHPFFDTGVDTCWSLS